MVLNINHIAVTDFLTRYWSLCENVRSSEQVDMLEKLMQDEAAHIAERFPDFSGELWSVCDWLCGRAEVFNEINSMEVENDD